ncbi:MAG: hypothetical protein HDT13_00620 [Butyrivibrio sp.]|nr:hypothetical protein [Butyrivibrio sp.]
MGVAVFFTGLAAAFGAVAFVLVAADLVLVFFAVVLTVLVAVFLAAVVVFALVVRGLLAFLVGAEVSVTTSATALSAVDFLFPRGIMNLHSLFDIFSIS